MSETKRSILIRNVDDVAAFVGALASNNRLIILELLVQGETPYSDMENATGMTQSALSQQLRYLRYLCLVSFRKERQNVYYRCDHEGVKHMIHALTQLMAVAPPENVGFKKTCKHCKVDFMAKRASRKFCSDVCRVASHRGDLARSPNLPNCRHCQAPFKPRRGGNVYCSRACANRAYRRLAPVPAASS